MTKEEIQQALDALRQKSYNAHAKIEALETIMLQKDSEKHFPGVTEEIKTRLVNRELNILKDDFHEILGIIYTMRTKSHA